MAKESVFIDQFMRVAKQQLLPNFEVMRRANLLYKIAVNHQLEMTSNTKEVENPRRGQYAFQTDLCIFEKISDDLRIPRVVLEFKTKATTHDLLTYSAKASKHKQIYGYLRYGMILSDENSIPSRFFYHNEALDFCGALKGLSGKALASFIQELVKTEIASSKTLEEVAYREKKTRFFRTRAELLKI